MSKCTWRVTIFETTRQRVSLTGIYRLKTDLKTDSEVEKKVRKDWAKDLKSRRVFFDIERLK